MKLTEWPARYSAIFSCLLVFCLQYIVWDKYSVDSILGQKDYPVTQKKIIRCLAVNPTNSLLHLKLAKIYIEQNEPEKAEAEFLNAEKLDFTDASIHYEIARSFLAMNRVEEAVREFKKAIFFSDQKIQLGILKELYSFSQNYTVLKEIIPNKTYKRFIFAGFLYDMKKYDESLEEFKKATVLAEQDKNHPIEAQSLNLVGILYKQRMKNYEMALKCFNKSIRLSEDKKYTSIVFYNLGDTYFDMGKIPEAEDAYKEAINNDPNRGVNYYGLGRCYEKLRLKPEARDYYRLAMQRVLNEEERLRVLRQLEGLGIDK